MNIDTTECCYYNSDNKEFPCDLYDNECEAQFCYFQQLQQVKAENEKAKKESAKYAQCLDEIEEICKTTIFDYPINKVKEILQKIKEVKENE